jgi:UDP-N-acetylglucosamine 2-epimerase (non-hydrolysing)
VRDPDHLLAEGADIDTIPQAIRWAAKLALRLLDGRRLRAEVFGGHGGVCVVHGDTPSTLLSALMARRAGLRVAHLEAGLRSKHLLHPFPEEAIRRIVMRISALLFAPDAQAVANLRRMRVRGRWWRCRPTRSSRRSPTTSSGPPPATPRRRRRRRGPPGTGPAMVTMHRVENLNRRSGSRHWCATVERMAAEQPVRFVLHGPTRDTMARVAAGARLRDAGVELVGLAPHGQFTRWLHEAPLVITDGGSIQEECALLGVPTLLWRAATERPDGLGANVVLSRYRPEVVRAFLADPQAHRRCHATRWRRSCTGCRATRRARLRP